MSETPTLAAALVAALAELTTVEKGNVADTGKYAYSYADIADVVRLTRPVLANHGIVALTPIHAHGDSLACTVVLVHSSGEQMTFGPLPFPEGKDAQATGSAITYHRRYALLSALGMAADEDDDGKAAVEGAKPRGQARKAAPRASSSKPASDKQVEFAKRLAADLGRDVARTVVPSIVEEVTGAQKKLHELTSAEISAVIDQLKPLSEQAKAADKAESAAHDEMLAEAEERAGAGEEPF